MYKLLLFLHILSAVVGIGNYMLAGLRASAAAKAGPPAPGAVGNAEDAAGKVADIFIYLIFITAIPLIIVGDREFSEMWISLSFLLYIVAVGISHGVMKPAARKARELGASGGGPEMPAIQQRLAIGGTVLNLLAVGLLALMIWQPGA
jgi:hypothetical protein